MLCKCISNVTFALAKISSDTYFLGEVPEW